MGRNYDKSTVPNIEFNDKVKFNVLKNKKYIIKFEDGGEGVNLTTLRHALNAMLHSMPKELIEDYDKGVIEWQRELTALDDNHYIRVWSDGNHYYANIVGNDESAYCQIFISALDGRQLSYMRSGHLLG